MNTDWRYRIEGDEEDQRRRDEADLKATIEAPVITDEEAMADLDSRRAA